MPKVTILIPAYNAQTYIRDAIDSVLRQRGAALLDIVVVNDGSTDATRQIVTAMAAEAPEIRLIETANQGVTRARNVCLEAIPADSDFVTFLDADDLSPADRLSRDLARFAARPDLEVRYGAMRMFKQADPATLAPRTGSDTLDIRSIQLGAGLYRRALIQRTGTFDLDFQQAEDTDFLFRLFESGPVYELTNDTSIYYRRHDTNMTRQGDIVRREFARALLKATRRRRSGEGAPLPEGLFDASNVRARMEA